MNFWDLDHPSPRIALRDEAGGRSWSYDELRQKAASFRKELIPTAGKQLGFILCANTPECVAAYVGALQAGAAVALFSSDLSNDFLASLVSAYEPDWIYSVAPRSVPERYLPRILTPASCLWRSNRLVDRKIAPELGVLLSTSGSTGAPKLVRLSYSNVQANAKSICEYLALDQWERPVTSLPFPYSYGLSVINSHLFAGATILLTDRSVMQREFWEFVDAEGATSFAGVPYTYQMLLKTKLLLRDTPITTFTQAGGRLEPKYIEQLYAITSIRAQRFFVMYGQTEASARISYVPSELLAENIGAVGVAIPGGSMRVDSETGELIYQGPNVMMGYANASCDLSKGDELRGELRTGDLAREDSSGMFYITGRMKRFLKIFGLRLSLDEIEQTLNSHFETSVACFGSDEQLQIAVENSEIAAHVFRFCCEQYKLHHSALRIMPVAQIPLNGNRKPDYAALAALATANAGLVTVGR